MSLQDNLRQQQQQTVLHSALQYCALGLYVFPVRVKVRSTESGKATHPPEKEPVFYGKWRKISTVDPQQCRDWWGPDGSAQGFGIGIDCGRSGLLVVDCDVKTDHLNGVENYRRLNLPPASAVVRTPSGGEHHYYYAGPGSNYSNGRGHLKDLGVDIRGNGGLVFAPPTVFNDQAYEPLPGRWLDGISNINEINPIPADLATLLGAPDNVREIRPLQRQTLPDSTLTGFTKTTFCSEKDAWKNITDLADKAANTRQNYGFNQALNNLVLYMSHWLIHPELRSDDTPGLLTEASFDAIINKVFELHPEFTEPDAQDRATIESALTAGSRDQWQLIDPKVEGALSAIGDGRRIDPDQQPWMNISDEDYLEYLTNGRVGGAGAAPPLEEFDMFSVAMSRDAASSILSDRGVSLWGPGQALAITGKTGCGKTTIALNLVYGLLGFLNTPLGMTIERAPEHTTVGYLAADRPQQVFQRIRDTYESLESDTRKKRFTDAMTGRFIGLQASVIDRTAMAVDDQFLARIAVRNRMSYFFIDSLKDIVLDTNDNVEMSMMKRQYEELGKVCELVILAHDKKDSHGGNADDIAGSMVIASGMGSHLSVARSDTDGTYKLTMGKGPAGGVREYCNDRISIPEETGISEGGPSIGWAELLASSRSGITTADAARQIYGVDEPNMSMKKRARREFDTLVDANLATKVKTDTRNEFEYFPVSGMTLHRAPAVLNKLPSQGA